MNSANAQLFARTIAVDWAVGKDAFQRIADEEDGEREGDDRTDEAGSESEDEVAEGVPNENELSVAEDAADSEEGGEEENDDDDDEIPVAEDEIDGKASSWFPSQLPLNLLFTLL